MNNFFLCHKSITSAINRSEWLNNKVNDVSEQYDKNQHGTSFQVIPVAIEYCFLFFIRFSFESLRISSKSIRSITMKSIETFLFFSLSFFCLMLLWYARSKTVTLNMNSIFMRAIFAVMFFDHIRNSPENNIWMCNVRCEYGLINKAAAFCVAFPFFRWLTEIKKKWKKERPNGWKKN